MLYAHKFFKTEKAAQDFQKKHGGALYADVPGSRIREDYRVVDEGPIQPDTLLEV